MKYCLQIPLGYITPGEFQTMPAVAEMAKALEAAKVDACYLTDHPAPDAKWLHANGHDALDPFTALAFVAAASTKLLVHSNIIVLPYRNPFLTAKSAATLQVLSGGRFILGVGGGYQRIEFDALGADFHKRGALTDEALEVIRLAWKGGAVTKQGGNFNAVNVEPRPVPNPAPKIWVGGGSEAAVQRAVRFGDGWSPFFTAPQLSKENTGGIATNEQLADKIKLLHELRAKAGQSGPCDVVVGARTPLTQPSKERAQQALDEIGEFERLGLNWLFYNTVEHGSRAGFVEATQWFGEEVIARR